MSKIMFRHNQTEEDFYSSADSDDTEITYPNNKLSIIEIESFAESRNELISKINDFKRFREIKTTHLNEKVNWSTVYYLFFCSHFTYLKQNKPNENNEKKNINSHQDKEANQQTQTHHHNKLSFNIKEFQFRIKHLTNKLSNISLKKHEQKKEISFPSVSWIDEPLTRLISKNMINESDKNKYISNILLNYPKSFKENTNYKSLYRKKTTLHLKRKSQNKLNLQAYVSTKSQSKKQVSPKSQFSLEQTGSVNISSNPIDDIYSFDKDRVNKQKREISPILNNTQGINKFLRKYPKYEGKIEHIKNNILDYELELNNKEKEIMKDRNLNYYRHYFKYHVKQEELMKEKKNTSIINRVQIKSTIFKSDNYVKVINEIKD